MKNRSKTGKGEAKSGNNRLKIRRGKTKKEFQTAIAKTHMIVL